MDNRCNKCGEIYSEELCPNGCNAIDERAEKTEGLVEELRTWVDHSAKQADDITRLRTVQAQLVSALDAAIDRVQLFLDTYGDMGEDYLTSADIGDWLEALGAAKAERK